MDFLTLPNRTEGNRNYGITAIADFGTPSGRLEQILEDYHPFIDIAKIAIGSAYITPNLNKKISLYKEYGIKPYFGGTLFEKCYCQKKIPEYFNWLKKLGIEWVEISCGTHDIPLEERLRLVKMAKKDFHVLTEVGSKNPDDDMPLSEWKKEMTLFLDAGCDYVITEGRDSGTAGIYQKCGTLKASLIQELIKGIDVKKIIFEAPAAKHQMYFINEIGANVNLGNVKPDDVLTLEAQRRGLRSETFYLEAYDEAYIDQTPAH